MAVCSSQGAVSKLAINGQQIPFSSVKDLSVRNLVDDSDDIITGFMDPLSERVSLGTLDLNLQVRLRPTPLELTVLLPLMGGTLSVGTWTLDEDVDNSFSVIVDRVAKVHTYATCYVAAWTLQGQKGTLPWALDLHLIGTSLTEGAAGSFSATALNTDGPYPFTAASSGLSLRSADRVFDRLMLSVNHYSQAQFENSLTANCIDMTKRRTTLALSCPYVAANTDLFTTPLAASTGAAGSLTLTKGGQSTAISFTNLKEIARPPDIPAKVAIRLGLFYRAYRTISTKAYSIVHDDAV